MTILKHLKSIISVVLYSVSCFSLMLSYIIPIYEYEGKGTRIPDIVSSDSVIGILILSILSIICASMAFFLKLKNRYVLYVFIALTLLNICKIIQVILVIYKVDKGILPIM
jgi:hypothetical protein